MHYEHPPGRQRFVSETEQIVDGASTYSTEQIRHENNVVALRPFAGGGVCFVVVDTIAEARLVDEVPGDVQRVRKIEDRGAQPGVAPAQHDGESAAAAADVEKTFPRREIGVFRQNRCGAQRTGMLTAAKGLGPRRITHQFLVLAPHLRAAVAADQRGEVAERRIDEPVCLEPEVIAEIVRSARDQVIVAGRGVRVAVGVFDQQPQAGERGEQRLEPVGCQAHVGGEGGEGLGAIRKPREQPEIDGGEQRLARLEAVGDPRNLAYVTNRCHHVHPLVVSCRASQPATRCCEGIVVSFAQWEAAALGCSRGCSKRCLC